MRTSYPDDETKAWYKVTSPSNCQVPNPRTLSAWFGGLANIKLLALVK